ncbi:DUF4241 domain-containing protein [Phycicoccus avicenniae]|uniref:DUF4241 domain-containing protein n=1 Tax=Phycicoccus avicenniae TaxID=2828860 RepID=UPI003D29920B
MTDLPPAQSLPDPDGALWWRKRARWMYAAVLDGELADHQGPTVARHRLERERVGRISLPGGLLVAADPYVMDAEPAPFVQALGAEEADVVAVRALVGEDHERVAALVLVAGPGPVVDWRMATLPGQDPSTLGDEEFLGYGVDAGTGSFGSPDAMRVAGRVLAEDEGMLEDPLSQRLFEDGIGTRSAAVAAPEPGAEPVAICSSGWGDGVYPTWLGSDASGIVVVAVTDFLLTGDPYASSPEDQPQDPPPTAPEPEAADGEPRVPFWQKWFGS